MNALERLILALGLLSLTILFSGCAKEATPQPAVAPVSQLVGTGYWYDKTYPPIEGIPDLYVFYSLIFTETRVKYINYTVFGGLPQARLVEGTYTYDGTSYNITWDTPLCNTLRPTSTLTIDESNYQQSVTVTSDSGSHSYQNVVTAAVPENVRAAIEGGQYLAIETCLESP